MKTFSLLSFLALLGATSAQSCGSFHVQFENYKCGGNGNGNGEEKSLGNQARKVIYNAMIDAMAELQIVTDSKESIQGSGNFKTQFSEAVTVTGYDAADRRELALLEEGDQEHRELFDCGPYNPSVGYPICSWCGWCRRRNLLEDAIQEAALNSGRSLSETQELLCDKVNDVLQNTNGIGCLKGATAVCTYDGPDASPEVIAGNRKEGIELESTPEADSGASILSIVIPAALAVVGLMA